jgi:dihydroorotase
MNEEQGLLSRRQFLQTAALSSAIGLSGAAAAKGAQTSGYDLLLKGGHVIDPANQIDGVMDVAVAGDKIAAVKSGIAAEGVRKVVDATGFYVTPGLIDIHAHVGHGGAPLDWFSPQARAHQPPLGIDPDLVLTSGVTTIVDAGSHGAETFLREKEEVIDHSQVRVLAWLNIVSDGMQGGLEQYLGEMDPERCARTIEQYPDIIVGVKTAHYVGGTDRTGTTRPLWAGVDRALKAGELTKKPIMVDFFPRPGRSYEDLILKKLRPGDVHTHVFAQQFPIIVPPTLGGKLNPAMEEARKRGVIFDVGHGSASFWFRNAAPAIQQGFQPDSISTDIHRGNLHQYVISLANVMSKCLAMGETLNQVIAQTTANPACEINRTELGTLSPGSVADIAVFRLQRGQFSYTDCGHARIHGDQKLTAEMTIRAGAIVYDPSGRSMMDWEKAPPQYFKSRGARADDFPRHVGMAEE